MTFGLLDVILLVIVLAFVFFGLFFGLVHTIGSLITTVVGLILAMHLSEPAFQAFGFMLGGGEAARVITFIIVFFLISRILGLLMRIVGGLFSWFSYIPFATTIDRLLGGLFGLFEGVLVVGAILFYAMQILPDDTLLIALKSSHLASVLMAMMSALQVFFPEIAK